MRSLHRRALKCSSHIKNGLFTVREALEQEVWRPTQPFLTTSVFVPRRTARYSPRPRSVIAVVFMHEAQQSSSVPTSPTHPDCWTFSPLHNMPALLSGCLGSHRHSNCTSSDYTSLRRPFHPASLQLSAATSANQQRVISAPAGTSRSRACCE